MRPVKEHKLPNSTKFHFLVIGDWGCTPRSNESCISEGAQRSVAQAMSVHTQMSRSYDASPAFLLNVGDSFYDNGVLSQAHLDYFRTRHRKVYGLRGLAGLTWHSVLGNHYHRGNTSLIVPGQHGALRYPAYWYHWFEDLPGGHYVHFIAIDTNWVQSQSICRQRPDRLACLAGFERSMEEQVQWLHLVLSNDNSTWRIVFGHHPVYAMGKWAFYDSNFHVTMASVLVPIFEQYGIHAYICGHEHSMQQIHIHAKLTGYLVMGSGGAILEDQPLFTRNRNVDSKAGLLHLSTHYGFGEVRLTADELCMSSMAAMHNGTCFTSCMSRLGVWASYTEACK